MMKKVLLLCLGGLLFSCAVADKETESAVQENADRLLVYVLNFDVLKSEDDCDSFVNDYCQSSSEYTELFRSILHYNRDNSITIDNNVDDVDADLQKRLGLLKL
jgi:hypothetical protein